MLILKIIKNLIIINFCTLHTCHLLTTLVGLLELRMHVFHLSMCHVMQTAMFLFAPKPMIVLLLIDLDEQRELRHVLRDLALKVLKGPVLKGPVLKGPVLKGLVLKGLALKGLALKGLANGKQGRGKERHLDRCCLKVNFI